MFLIDTSFSVTGDIKCFLNYSTSSGILYSMDGFCAYGVGSCYDCFVVFVIARYYLLTQGANFCKLCPYLLGYFLGFLLGVCNRGFLLLDQSLGGADLFF